MYQIIWSTTFLQITAVADSPVLQGTYDGPRVFFGASPASYHSLIGGPPHEQRHTSTAEEFGKQICGFDEFDHDSYATPPGPT